MKEQNPCYVFYNEKQKRLIISENPNLENEDNYKLLKISGSVYNEEICRSFCLGATALKGKEIINECKEFD